MANHKSAKKRIRSDEKKRILNRYQLKTARTEVKKLTNTDKKEEALLILNSVVSKVDKLAKKNVIHWKKAANIKSKLTKKVNAISAS